jgi:SAM-dependent MidA family methyltransferase
MPKQLLNDNPFEHIGEQDITTSVNFSDIAEQAFECGFTLSGYATQARSDFQSTPLLCH